MQLYELSTKGQWDKMLAAVNFETALDMANDCKFDDLPGFAREHFDHANRISFNSRNHVAAMYGGDASKDVSTPGPFRGAHQVAYEGVEGPLAPGSPPAHGCWPRAESPPPHRTATSRGTRLAEDEQGYAAGHHRGRHILVPAMRLTMHQNPQRERHHNLHLPQRPHPSRVF